MGNKCACGRPISDRVTVPAVAIDAGGTAERVTMTMSAKLHQSIGDAIKKIQTERKENE